jgi:uncharacterized protein
MWEAKAQAGVLCSPRRANLKTKGPSREVVMFEIGKLVKGPSALAKARSSRIHGRGLFAKKDIPEGERIIEYTGEKITKAEGNRRYDEQVKNGQIYLFELNSRYDIDGSARGNIAKYANHSCDPNAEAVVEKGEIWLVALKDIAKGEEITFDYNFPLFDYEKRPCRCGSGKCRGWIVNQDSYYYLRRKNRTAKKGGASASKPKKGAGVNGAQVPHEPLRKTATRTDAKPASKKGGTKAAGKQAAKKTGAKKGARRSSGKEAAKKATTKKSARKTSGKKSGKKAAKKGGSKRTGKKTTGKKATRKASAKKSARKTRGKKSATKAPKKATSGTAKKKAAKKGVKKARRSS